MIKNNKRQNSRKQKAKKKKIKTIQNFAESTSLLQVVGFPSSNKIINTQPLTEIHKQLFLERFKKEIIKPFRNTNIWKQRIVLGTNQCSRVLENSSSSERPLLCICSRDIYPPTMLAHVPVLCQNQEIPLLVLNGKATLELGTALGIRKTSIVLILPKSKNDNDVNDEKAIDSFCNYVVSLIESE